MDPYHKGMRISAIIHIGVLVAALVGIAFSHWLKPRPAAHLTMVEGPPKGLLAGGAASQEPQKAEVAPQAPKLATPPQSQTKEPAKQPIRPVNYKTDITPQKAPSKPAPTPRPKPTPRPQPQPKPQKISFADYQRKHSDALEKQTQYYDKISQPKQPQRTAPKTESYTDFASRLDKRISSASSSRGATQRTTNPGSGELGNGVAGATQDLERLYSSTLHQYLNSLWREPSDLGGARLSARVEFTVDANGRIKNWRITKGSGVSEFDRSVSAVFEKTSSVPQPPKAIEYRLSVTFETRNG